MVLLIGLAVGVDYSMFYLKRERQERAAGRSEQAALEAAAATSGRSVLISGLTVMIAMAGMFLTGDPTFASLGLATILVVAVAVLGSLTVLPGAALEARRQGRPAARPVRRPAPPRRRRRPDLGRDRRPRPAPARAVRGPRRRACCSRSPRRRCSCTSRTPGPESFPQSLAVIKTYNADAAGVPRLRHCPANVVVKAPNVNAPAVREAIRRLEQRALASGRAYEPITVDVNKDAHGREHHRPDRGQRNRRRVERRRSRVLRDEIVPRDRRRRSRTPRPASPG